jgi:hypothetical protein
VKPLSRFRLPARPPRRASSNGGPGGSERQGSAAFERREAPQRWRRGRRGAWLGARTAPAACGRRARARGACTAPAACGYRACARRGPPRKCRPGGRGHDGGATHPGRRRSGPCAGRRAARPPARATAPGAGRRTRRQRRRVLQQRRRRRAPRRLRAEPAPPPPGAREQPRRGAAPRVRGRRRCAYRRAGWPAGSAAAGAGQSREGGLWGLHPGRPRVCMQCFRCCAARCSAARPHLHGPAGMPNPAPGARRDLPCLQPLLLRPTRRS